MADLAANFPDIRTPFINSNTGQIDQAWWHFLLSLFTRTGSEPGSSSSENAAAILLLQAAVALLQGDVEALFQLVEESGIEIGNVDAKASSLADMVVAITRQFETDPDSLRAAINQVSDSLFSAVRQLEVDPESIRASVNRVNDLLVAAIRQTEADPGSLYAAINRASDSLVALERNLEIDVTRPPFLMPRSFSLDYLDFDQTPSYVGQPGRAAWNPTDDTLNIHHSGGVTQQVGLETYARITNNSGVTIDNGQAISFDPGTNSFLPFIADGTLSPLTIIGIATEQIINGALGRITVWGRVRDLDTTGTPVGEIWAAGQILYTSTTIAGALTNVKPTAPNVSLPIAQVRVVSSTVGQIVVRPTIEQQLFYGQFSKTTDQVPSAINTANPITWTAALIANGLSIGAPASRIVAAHAGLYNFSASFQLTSGSASVKNVWLWYRKNGVDIANSALITSMDSGTAVRAPSRTLLISLAAGDYVELVWAADDVNVTLDAVPATAFAPAAPAALLTVNQEQQ